LYMHKIILANGQLVNEADNAAFGGIALSLLFVPHCGLLNRLIPQVSWSRN
jgi:hypothetical protein